MEGACVCRCARGTSAPARWAPVLSQNRRAFFEAIGHLSSLYECRRPKTPASNTSKDEGISDALFSTCHCSQGSLCLIPPALRTGHAAATETPARNERFCRECRHCHDWCRMHEGIWALCPRREAGHRTETARTASTPFRGCRHDIFCPPQAASGRGCAKVFPAGGCTHICSQSQRWCQKLVGWH